MEGSCDATKSPLGPPRSPAQRGAMQRPPVANENSPEAAPPPTRAPTMDIGDNIKMRDASGDGTSGSGRRVGLSGRRTASRLASNRADSGSAQQKCLGQLRNCMKLLLKTV